ncbi:HmuY family protein [Pseudenhygromyxa sp. WMMC2535]|uniref:HmuY family protein n=1 Tax=Pseudenhygromyxa sp. WMMC2535 TaxID=2712867 RepID=UPI001556D3A5|nr:HmuY family protein [Pseudenhygromyxa sp. WMMC2535]NVB39883.1 HmuY family protein [Pseudenhygromyxa sp. WMMC2535]
MIRKIFIFAPALALLVSSGACTDDAGADTDESGETGSSETADTEAGDDTTDTDTDTDTDVGEESTDVGETTDTGEGELCGDIPCEDALILDLSLQEKVAEGAVSSVQEGDDWVSSVDATAGGTANAATNPWVYMRFGAAGLEKLDIDDYDALSSADWHIATKRYGIRVNSGSAGPGCVTVASANGAYADIDAVPGDASFSVENFYDDECVLIEDASGLAGNPNYNMAQWWGYTGCVTTTGQVYLIDLGDAGVVKFVVDAYYAEGQETCNQSGTMGTGSAEVTWRWRFL